METVPPHHDVVDTPPPIRRSKGKGVQEEAISKGARLDSLGLFSRDFETRIIVFITLTVIHVAECFFHTLHDIVYEI